MSGRPTSRPALLLAAAGTLVLAFAAIWWAVVFVRVIANGYLPPGQSAVCAVASSIVCDLAMSLCGKTHPLGITWFSPVATWLALGLLSASALMTPLRSEPR